MRPRVLHLARNYPNSVFPTLGLWTQRLVIAASASSDPVVVAPVPYAPPLLPIETLAQFRAVERQRRDGDVEVRHPRFPAGPGMLLHRFEARLTLPPVRRTVEALQRQRPFDLIHAHFIYPEGVIAASLGRRFGVPVISTEQAAWRPWLDTQPSVRSQVVRILPAIQRLLPVSGWLAGNIAETVPNPPPMEILHNVVDEETFSAALAGEPRDPDQILFVGLVRRVKGLDILVRALARLVARRPRLRLLVLGGAFYRAYQRDHDEVRRIAGELGVATSITFGGEASPREVSAAMRRSALLVVPSRRETFSAVTVESLASGTPVVATRCGGPEEILTPETGLLVPPEDPDALAAAIDDVLDRTESFDPATLREYALSRFGRAVAATRLATIYDQVLRDRRSPET